MTTLADYDDKIALFNAQSQRYAAKAATLRGEHETKRAKILEQTSATYADLRDRHIALREDKRRELEAGNAS